MTIETEIEQLIQDTKYHIAGYEITEDTILLFATELNAAQDEIAKTMYGRDIQIFKSI